MSAKHKLNDRPALWTATALARNVLAIDIPIIQNNSWSMRSLLSSDRHIDAIGSDHNMQKRHLEEVQAGGGFVVDNGDFFDAISSRNDRRGGKTTTRSELTGPGIPYFNRLIEMGADFVEPYAESWAMFGDGNHEESISKYSELSLMSMVVQAIRGKTGQNIHYGGYSGYVFFRFRSKGGVRTITLYYEHGSGGGGVMTMDILNHKRKSIWLPDPDIIVTGHTHDYFAYPQPRQRVTPNGRIYTDHQWHIKIPSYCDGRTDGFSGWEARSGMPPKPIGAVWLDFSFNRSLGLAGEVEFKPSLAN